HLGLQGMEAALLVLAAALVLRRSMPPPRWLALTLAITCLATTRSSLRQLSFWGPLRAAAFEETTTCATVLDATVALGIAPPARPPRPAAPPPRSAPPRRRRVPDHGRRAARRSPGPEGGAAPRRAGRPWHPLRSRLHRGAPHQLRRHLAADRQVRLVAGRS